MSPCVTVIVISFKTETILCNLSCRLVSLFAIIRRRNADAVLYTMFHRDVRVPLLEHILVSRWGFSALNVQLQEMFEASSLLPNKRLTAKSN